MNGKDSARSPSLFVRTCRVADFGSGFLRGPGMAAKRAGFLPEPSATGPEGVAGSGSGGLFVRIHAQFDRRPRPLVDPPFLGTDAATVAGDLQVDLEGTRRVDVVARGQRVGYDVDIEHQMVARSGREPCRAERGNFRGPLREVRSHAGDLRGGRGESRAAIFGVETAAHERDVVAPPLLVAARDFDGESLVYCHIRQI